jgi:hypothetical protein
VTSTCIDWTKSSSARAAAMLPGCIDVVLVTVLPLDLSSGEATDPENSTHWNAGKLAAPPVAAVNVWPDPVVVRREK